MRWSKFNCFDYNLRSCMNAGRRKFIPYDKKKEKKKTVPSVTWKERKLYSSWKQNKEQEVAKPTFHEKQNGIIQSKNLTCKLDRSFQEILYKARNLYDSPKAEAGVQTDQIYIPLLNSLSTWSGCLSLGGQRSKILTIEHIQGVGARGCFRFRRTNRGCGASRTRGSICLWCIRLWESLTLF